MKIINLIKDNDYTVTDWKPGDDIGIIFDDKTAEDRNSAEIGKMVKEMRKVSNKYNFDLSMWGIPKNLIKVLKP